MVWYGYVMGTFGWLGMFAIWLILVDRQAWQSPRLVLVSAQSNRK